MANTPLVRATLAEAALRLAPPVIRGALLADDAFCAAYGFDRDATITFGTHWSAQRSAFLSAVRRALTGQKNVKVRENDGTVWKLERAKQKGLPPRLRLVSDSRTLNLPDLDVLSANAKVRLRSLEAAVADVKLPSPAADAWRKILAVRPLSDDELHTYFADIRNTPVGVARTLADEIESGQSKLTSLVPTNREYYARLVGPHAGEKTAADFALPGATATTIDDLTRLLRLSAHPGFRSQVDLGTMPREALAQLFQNLLATGNRLSQIGAIELALKLISVRDDLIEPTMALIAQVVGDDPAAAGSGFKSLAALFVLVDGELSRLRLYRNAPPFYRRLAALAQACLIQDTLNTTRVDQDGFAEWALKTRGGAFYMQTLVDLREEPRWDPDLVSPAQFKADFLSRIVGAAKAYENDIKTSPLHEIILGAGASSILSRLEPFIAFLPGPLEGAAPARQPVPPEFAKIIEEQVSSPEIGAPSFFALVNSASVFELESNHAELAAKALKMGSHRLSNLKDRDQLQAVLHGLAVVAAVTRSGQLADEVRALLRHYRQDPQYRVHMDEALRYGVIAAASCTERAAWARAIGDWIAELSFADMNDAEGAQLDANLELLCGADDSLKMACGRARAALNAFLRKA